MIHRHLKDGVDYILPVIDDVIDRGKRADWAELRAAALADRALMAQILHIASTHVGDPYAQRYHFWRQYAEQHLKIA
ncbi:MAG: hypothetical protein WB424_05675 [Terracidiphilus sp.]|jgi:hypothetical protein